MLSYGSVCSGIEAAHFAFSPLGYKQLWSSEIAPFPTKVLQHYYPNVPNLGNMVNLPELIMSGKVDAPDILCGGTPCQAFSLAGWKNGLDDDRGLLTMKFIEIADGIDSVRAKEDRDSSIIIWENVEGVLNDRTNAFGNFIGGLSGDGEEIICNGKWPKSGFYEGGTRRIAWRVLDSKYFGLPQQRKRLYVVATGKKHHPDQVLFEFGSPKSFETIYNQKTDRKPDLFNFEDDNTSLVFIKNGVEFEVFRDYTDCLYAAYGTKWNGNAAAYNGSLYVAQNGRIRRLIPEECELLMGFPRGYTDIEGSKHTTRYQGTGNSWAVPVVKWIGERICNSYRESAYQWKKNLKKEKLINGNHFYRFGDKYLIKDRVYLNTTVSKIIPEPGNMKDIVCESTFDKFYISAKACRGILRRRKERNLNMNSRLEFLMKKQASELVEN